MNWWMQQAEGFRSRFHDPKSFVYYLFRFIAPFLLIVFGVYKWRKRRGMSDEDKAKAAKQSSLRKFLGQTLSLVSPKLAQWVTGEAAEEPIVIDFYHKYSKLLQKHQFRRTGSQTQQEFANHVAQHYSENPQRGKIAELVDSLTGKFYQVRFGGIDLNPSETGTVETQLSELEALLDSSNPAAAE